MNREHNREVLKSVVEGILSGQLEHNQKDYHCGSAHCVAGWYEVLKGGEEGFTYDNASEHFLKGDDCPYFFVPRFAYADHAVVIGEDTGIEFDYLDDLFRGENSLEDIKLIWEGIEEKYYETK